MAHPRVVSLDNPNISIGGGPVKYPSAPRKSDVPSTSSINNRRQTVSAPHVDIDHSDEDASNKSDMDADEDRSRDGPKKKVQDDTEGAAGLGNREVGRDGTEAVSAAGDNSSKAVPKPTKNSVENQKGLGKRLKGKVGLPLLNCPKASPDCPTVPGCNGDQVEVEQNKASRPCDASGQGAEWSQERALCTKGGFSPDNIANYVNSVT